MAQYDGSIRIGTRIDEKGFKVGSKELEAGARSLAKSVSNSLGEGAKIALQKQTDAFVKLNQQYAVQEQKVKDLAGKLHDMQRQKIETAEFKELSKDLDKAKASLDRLYDRRDSYIELGKKVPPKLDLDISDAERKIKILESDIKELISENKAYLPVDTNKIRQEIDLAEQRQMQLYSALQNSADTLGLKISQNIEKEEIKANAIKEEIAEEERLAQIRENAVVGNQRIIETVERIKQLEQEIADLKSAGITEGYSDFDNRIQELSSLKQEVIDYNNGIEQVKESYVRLGDVVRSAFATIGKGLIGIPIAAVKKGAQGLLTVFSKLGSVVKKSAIAPFKMMGNVAKSAFSKISQHARKSGGFLSKFGSQVKGMVSSFLIFNQIRKIFSSTIKAIKEGFSNLYNENTQFKSSVDSLKASILTLKNALASAFAPIVETAIPYIQRLVEWLTKAADSVGQLLAALMGRKTYTKAVKQTAAAANDAAKATKKEADAMEEAQEAAEGYLSPLDEINKYKKEEIKNSKKTTPEEIEENPAEQIGNMFEEVPISDKFKDIAQWLKDMWENADFTELGAFLGQKLKDALDNIPWEEIKETASEIGKSLATLINGFVEVEGLGESIGRTLAEAINTGFEFLNAFVHNLHWESIGKFIAETINGFFTNIDWDLIYDTFITGAKGLGDAINSFVDYLDWEAISNSISNFFNTFVDTVYEFVTTVDWKGLGEKVGKTISDAWTGIDWKKAGETLGETFKAFFDFVGNAIENVDWWAVGESVKEFLVGIDWAGVAESFFEAIGAAIGGLAAFLGGLIADGVEAAKEYFQDKIEEAGGNVVLGILKGIGDAIVGIGEWIYEHVFTPFINGFKEAFGIHSPSTVMAEMGTYIIQGLLNGLQEMWTSVIDWWNNTALAGWWNDNVAPWFTAEKWLELFQNIQTAFSDMWNALVEWWNGTAIVGWWEENVVPWFTAEKWLELFENIKTSLKEVWDNTVGQWIEDISAWWEEHVAPWFTIEKWEDILSSVPEAFSNGFAKVVDTVKEKIQAVIDWVVEKVDWLKEKVESVKDFFGGIASKVGGFFGGSSFRTSSYSMASYSTLQSPAFASLSATPIPALARGAVIPANREFLAVLGDQKHGTNIEAPLDTIKQASTEALLEVMSRLGITGGNRNATPVNLTLQVALDGQVLGQKMVDWGKLQQMATGNNPYALGNA